MKRARRETPEENNLRDFFEHQTFNSKKYYRFTLVRMYFTDFFIFIIGNIFFHFLPLVNYY